MRISRFGWVVAAMVTVIMLTSSFASAAPRSGPHMVPAGTLASLGLVTIEANGSVVPSGAPISVAGTTYTLTGTINGSLLVVANDVTVDGADHLVNYTVGMVGGDNAAVTVQGSTSDVLENFRSSNSSIGILVEAASGATVRDNSVGGNATSIEVNRSSDVVISGNHEDAFPGEGTGLQVTSSSGVTVTGNVFDERKTGISLDNVSRAVVMANSANRTVDAGIDLTNTSQVEIVSNWAEGSYNASSAPDGVYVDLSSYVTISDSSFNGSYDGAFVYDSHDLTFASDNASFTAYGFALEYTVQATVTRSTAFGSGYGLFSEYSEDVTFSNNSLAHDTIGISDEYDSHLLATGNSAPSSTAAGEGVRAFGSSDSTYLDNNLSHAANYGALAEQTSNVTFTGNDLSQFEYYGLYLQYTYGTVTVDGNNLSGSPYFYSVGAESYEPYGPLNFTGNDVKHLYTGLEFYYAYSPIQVYDNDIRFSAQYAVYADSVKGPVTVSDNDLSHSYEGIYSYYQAGGTLTALRNNISDSYSGVISESYGAGYSALTVSGNTLVNDGYGVYLYEIDGPISVTNNNLFNSTYDGVYVFDCVDGPTLISGNNLSNAHYAGVDVYAGAEVTISDNQIVNSTDYGIELGSDYGVDSVFGNDLQRSQYYGLYQYSSVLGGIDAVGNTASGSDYAAYIESDSYPVVLSGNDLSNSREVYLYQDLLAQFTGNDLLNDEFIGFDSNTIGLFDHNDINSTAFSQSGNLIEGGVWSAAYPVGGNYWTGYTGTDRYSGPGQNLSGSDGLGDVPYSLAGATDQYPLEAPWTNPTVTFEESGLPAGTAWSIDLNGVTMTASAGSVIGFPQVNGANTPFTYTATTTAKGYSTASPSGSGTERGSDELISIVFGSGPGGRPVYEVTITETGLPAGLSWSVTLNGTTMSTTATSITFPEGKGTYTYSVTVPSGYSVSPSGGSITVSASNAALAVSVSYAPSPSTGSPAPTSTSSFSNETGYGLVAALGVVVVVALVGWALFARKGRGGASATPPPPWSEGPPGPGSPPPTPTAPPPPAPPTPVGGGSGPAP